MQGSFDKEINYVTELIMSAINPRIKDRGESALTTGQYNSVYEAVQTELTNQKQNRR